MNSAIEGMLKELLDKSHHRFRQNLRNESQDGIRKDFTDSCQDKNITYMQRATERLVYVLELEKPVVLPHEKIAFLRTVVKIPEIYTEAEWTDIKSRHYIHELGKVCNICPDYAYTIKAGLGERRREALQRLESCEAAGDIPETVFLQAVIKTIDAVEGLARRYAEAAEAAGNTSVAGILRNVPANGARTFHEALQFFRILHFALWCSGNYHNTIGRFDQYMYPYLKADLEEGRLTYDGAFELLEEFFISFNKDSDLYPGMQQGDNGQSLVLGGLDRQGKDAFNPLSEMCLKASLELKLIDPKINLRVNRYTPAEVYELAMQLTKQGLGFPQYSNDEVVIPGLIGKGYAPEDARDYAVAACWEFIIPGKGMDIPNIGALSFAKAVDSCVHKHLRHCTDFRALMDYMKEEIKAALSEQLGSFKSIYMEPSPFMSLLMDGRIENARDISAGAVYNNYGLHGTGISTAADSLAAIKKYVFENREVSAEELLDAVDNDFSEHYDLWIKLRYLSPKLGNDDDYADDIAVELFDYFAEALQGRQNERGGCYRAGTGSAMYYLWHARDAAASPDGRKKGEPLSANLSPSLHTKVKGPVSILRSFSKIHFENVINGGPLTLELHDTVFRDDESIRKAAMLVRYFMDSGGHQLQLNAVNKDKLLDAQKNPGAHRNLIVRVWGWSGYFTELDREYQDHIIQRVELVI